MSEPLVSVITPAYNAAFLGATVESVLEQTYRNSEMLIIDDGSTDDTVAIAQSYAARDCRIKVLLLGCNSGGPATPRNHGIKNASGEYIAFLDADDIWLAQKLQKQVTFMEANKDVFLLYCQCIVERDGKQLKIEPVHPKSGRIFNDLLYNNVVDCLTVIMRNRKDQNRYFFDDDKELVAVEDYAMWLAIAREERVGFIPESLAVYRIHPGGISSGAFANFRKCGLVLNKFTHLVGPGERVKVYFNFYTKLIFVGIITILICIKRALIQKGVLKVRKT